MWYRNGLIAITLMVSLMLDILPLPGWVLWLRPNWTLLVLIYWAMVVPSRVSIGVAFFVGLLLDLLNGTMLGEHALAFVIVIYFVAKFPRRLQLFPMLQQMLTVFILLFVYKFVIFTLQGLVGELPNNILYWFSILISVVLWPWASLLLQDWQRRFNFEV